MSDLTNNTLERDDDLDQMLRDVIASRPVELEWPADDVIHAYVTGVCSDEQREHVLAVLARSHEFRRLIVDTSAQIASLQSTEMQAEFDELTSGAFEPSPASPPRSIVDTLWEWLSTVTKPRVLAPALGVVAVLVLALLSPMDQSRIPGRYAFVADSEVEAETFVRVTIRDSETPPAELPPAVSARQAAVQALQNCITYDMRNDRFTIVPSQDTSPISGPMDRYTITLEPSPPHEPVELTFELPQSARTDNESVQAWLMTPPSLRLWQVDVRQEQARLLWPDAAYNTGCITMTYRDGSVYRFVPPRVVELQD
ncbi:MAG: hypothetical protein GF341_08465 [candidate division Zixibacteria bacterium]|nr:hypothetical protein [candidate division Zixibacteria bacterium]